MVKPFRALDFYIQPQDPTPREGAPAPILLLLISPVSIRHSDARCEIEQGQDPPQCQNRQLNAQTNSPGQGWCIERIRLGSDRRLVRYSLRQVHRNIYAELQHVHKRSNNSIIIKPIHIPLSPLGFCTRSPTPIVTEGGLDRSYPRIGPVSPQCTGLGSG